MLRIIKITSFVLSVLLCAVSSCCLVGCDREEKCDHHEVSLVLNDGIVSGKSAYKFVNNTSTTLTSVKFNLFFNAYTSDGKIKTADEDNCGLSEIYDVTADGKSAEYSFSESDDCILEIKTPPIAKNSEIDLTFGYKITLPKGDSRLSDAGYAINLG
ncbi:MAG: hypothetical protein MJ072_05050, partial [Clostridia bacterium]|nr:hypothetical protein [Clostridia bacterium]